MSRADRPTAIVGAGLAGLIAAHAWPTSPIFEAAPGPAAMHRALLRFRSEAVSRLTGIEFRQVRVRKGIWSRGQFVAPSIGIANSYALKTLGKLVPERSIWSVDPADRFIAPDDFYERLIEAVGDRVHWGVNYDFASDDTGSSRVVSTAPMPLLVEQLRPFGHLDFPTGINFTRSPIVVDRYEVSGADVFQTIYFPDREQPVYRASITGKTLIVESVPDVLVEPDLADVFTAFGIDGATKLERAAQKFGKIAPIPDDVRKDIMWRLTHFYRIYSLGRFATWRNILLDDVVDDVAVIKRLMRSSSYDVRRATT